LRRFKTGTTPRIAKSSINFSRVEAVPSEADAGTISFLPGYRPDRPLLPTWQTFTQPATHQVIQENLGHSAMYGGQISGSGPRYCPSIEDKVVRFAEKDSHPVWLEQETWDGESFYVQGVSTSLPEEVQLAFLRTIPGLADVLMLRPGYAVEYDMADPLQLSPHLMSQELDGLFLAGQLNGTSGYEEAAGQGLVAGINAAHYAQEKPPVDFPRDESFIGVMIDDLTTKGVDDPYRMLTGRSEHRLLLRSDNADARLTPKAKELGLASEERIRLWETKREAIERGQAWMENTYVTTVANDRLTERGSAPVAGRASLFDLCRRPELRLEGALAVYAQANPVSNDPEVRTQIELAALYDGYWQRQQRTAEESRRLDTMRIPDHWDYKALTALSAESREKLARVRPATIGQASRVPGVRASDIAVLIGFLRAAQAATTSA
jgi:tRNA uridine 5-carboxymethylaminomethyl modification enzyme